MNWAVFGGFSKAPFRDGWTRETAIAVFGGGELDLTRASPGAGAVLRAVAVLGGVEVIVPEGSRVALSGRSRFGGRDGKAEPGAPGRAIARCLQAVKRFKYFI